MFALGGGKGQERAGQFQYLMDVVGRWTQEETMRYGGPFRHLREGLWMREFCVTPGFHVNVAQIKTYLATAILNIYPWNNSSKVSFRDIERSLSGDASAKKYGFYFEDMDRCFSREGNRRAVELSCLVKPPLDEDMTEIPFALMEHIQTHARHRLGEYWQICDPESKFGFSGQIRWKPRTAGNPNEDEELSAKMQNKYMECVMTIALHEIFTRECGRLLEQSYEEAQRERDCIPLAKDMLSQVAGHFAAAEQEQHPEIVRHLAGTMQRTVEYAHIFGRYLFLLSAYAEHISGLETEVSLVMITEMKNLESMQTGKRQHQIQWLLECMEGREADNNFCFNKNRGKYYRQLREDMKELFGDFAERIRYEGRRDYRKAAETWLSLAARRTYGKEEREKMWEAQYTLMLPFWIQNFGSDV